MRAAFAVNRELILLYWSMGRDILVRQQAEGWGTKRVTRELPTPIREEVPTVEDLEEVVTKLRGEMEALRRERHDEK